MPILEHPDQHFEHMDPYSRKFREQHNEWLYINIIITPLDFVSDFYSMNMHYNICMFFVRVLPRKTWDKENVMCERREWAGLWLGT